jgi:predicted RNase H-like HicB family nuclease
VNDPGLESDAARDLAYYEAVPYVLVIESIERGGQWVRRATYPELPGCVAEAHSALEAMEHLEHERRRLLRQLWNQGAPIPVPRPPLRRA